MNRIDKLLPVLLGGALGAADSLGRKLNSGKNSDQKQPTKRNNTKAGRLKRKKRQMQKNSRRRNRR